MPYMDHMLDMLIGRSYYYFCVGYFGYNQITITLEVQEKTIFTCLYGKFAFKKMIYRLCNMPSTFQKCMMSMFSETMEDSIEIFIEYFLVVKKFI